MMARLGSWVRERPLVAFYLLAFVLTWLGWAPQALYSHGLFPFDSFIFYLFGGVGPLLAAYLVLRALHGDKAFGALFAPLLRWRVGAVWYGLALLGYPALRLAALVVAGEGATALDNVTLSAGWLLGLAPLFLSTFVAAIPEELAWRAFALPRLQARNGALVASLIVGFLWALWHLPLLLVKDSVMSTYPLLPFFVQSMALTVVYAWLYNSTGSALIITIFHAVSNMVGPFLGWPQAAVTVGVAIVIVAICGPVRLARREGAGTLGLQGA